MSDERPKKSLTDHARDALDGLMEAIEELFAPEPQLIPVRQRPMPRPNPRRRR